MIIKVITSLATKELFSLWCGAIYPAAPVIAKFFINFRIVIFIAFSYNSLFKKIIKVKLFSISIKSKSFPLLSIFFNCNATTIEVYKLFTQFFLFETIVFSINLKYFSPITIPDISFNALKALFESFLPYLWIETQMYNFIGKIFTVLNLQYMPGYLHRKFYKV